MKKNKLLSLLFLALLTGRGLEGQENAGIQKKDRSRPFFRTMQSRMHQRQRFGTHP